MKKKSVPSPLQNLQRWGFFFYFFPFIYPVLLAIVGDASLDHLLEFLGSEIFILLAVTAWVTGYGWRHLRRWSLGVSAFLGVLVLLGNLFFFDQYAETYHLGLGLVSLFLGQGALGFYFWNQIRVPYFFPRIRWWESQKRYKLSLPTEWEEQDSQVAYPTAFILDLSSRGCFLKTRTLLPFNTNVALRFNYQEWSLTLRGRVVWQAAAAITYPEGLGIEWLRSEGFAEAEEWKKLKRLLKRLRKLALHYRRNRYWMPPELFLSTWEAIEKGSPPPPRG